MNSNSFKTLWHRMSQQDFLALLSVFNSFTEHSSEFFSLEERDELKKILILSKKGYQQKQDLGLDLHFFKELIQFALIFNIGKKTEILGKFLKKITLYEKIRELEG